ncbi:MAG: ABC transporter substrate-binding protein [Lachnospiraceae bacterium]|nr:ABC transporter substrate-binding protein [Lachnospiraceae bacterium]
MKKVLTLTLAAAMLLGSTAAFAEEEAEGINVAVIGPLTGPYAIYGLNCANALEIAAKEINELDGVKLNVLTAQDDQGDPTLSVNAYNTLMDDGMQILIGTVTSGACIAVGTETNSDRVFTLTPSASNDLVTEDKDNVFQICFTDSNQGRASAQYISENSLGKKIGVIYNNSIDYSMGIYKTFAEKADELGLDIVAVEAFSDDNNADFSVQIASMKKAGADLIFLPIYYTPASVILAQAKAAEYEPIFFGVDGMDGILTMEGFDQSLAEGVMLLTPFSASSTDPVTKAFVEKYQEAYGDIPNQFAADTYDAAYVTAALCEKAGITADMDPEDICEALIEAITDEEFEYEGITGTMRWSEDGTVTKTPQAVVIENGEYIMYGSGDDAEIETEAETEAE